MQSLLNGLGWFAANWVALVVVLLAFGFIIFVHELGHFLTAKRVGITVHEFALGFGPKLFSRTVNGTEYCLRVFPFGGFVRMEGEDDPDGNPADPGSFQNKSVMAQIVVLGGGCFMNYVSALAVLIALGFLRGIPDLVPPSIVDSVQENKPAARAGIQKGDRIVAVNGTPVGNFRELLAQVRPRGGQEITVSVDRSGQPLTFTLTPDLDEDKATHEQVGRMGVVPPRQTTLSWRPATGAKDVFDMAGGWVVRITVLPFEIIARLTRSEVTLKEVREGTGGPLLILQMLFELYHQGIWALLFFWAIICTSVGSFNLLPIPALDGARILFVSIGALRGRPLDPRKEGLVHMVGLAVLLVAMGAFSVHDVVRMMRGVKFF